MDGVPYKVYENTSDIVRFLWSLMRTAREKRTIPKMWCRAGGVLIPKEKDAANISQSRPVSLLNVKRNQYIDTVATRLS